MREFREIGLGPETRNNSSESKSELLTSLKDIKQNVELFCCFAFVVVDFKITNNNNLSSSKNFSGFHRVKMS